MLDALALLTVIAAAPSLSTYPEASADGDTLTMTAGTTNRVTLRVPLTGPPTQFSQVLVRSTGWLGVADILPMGEIVRLQQQPSAVDVAVLISASAVTTARRAAIRIVVNDPNIGRQVGEITWRPTLIVQRDTSASGFGSVIDTLKSARNEVLNALSSLGPVAASMRKTRMAVLRPATAQYSDALLPVIRAQGQAQAASARLRAAAIEGHETAARALAEHRGSAFQPSARILERTTPEKGLRRAAALLKRFQLERAMGWTDGLIDSQRLQRAELARALTLRGAVFALGGSDEKAKLAFGQASCLDPVARPPSTPTFDQDFRRLGEPPGCARPINTLGVSALRSAAKDAVLIKVSVAYGPDPFNLITGGMVQLFTPSGASIAQQPGAPEIVDGEKVLTAEFIDEGKTVDPAGQIYVGATLEGAGRVAVAEVGQPEPMPVKVENDGIFGGLGVPLWLWITLGVVAIGGATAATVAVVSGDDTPSRGIGPVDVRF